MSIGTRLIIWSMFINPKKIKIIKLGFIKTKIKIKINQIEKQLSSQIMAKYNP